MPSPPKPWEVNNNVTSPTVAAEITAPEVPSRTIEVPARPTGYGSTGYGSTGYGSTGYGSTGYGSTGYGGYGNSYGGYGGSYGGYGSSYGGYGNSYGGYGSSYGGYGGYGGYGNRLGMNNMNGMNRFGPGMSLTQQMEQGTRPTFEVVENIVGSFGGFAQMLDSTFMATHSSFMAIMGVAEQFGHLRNYLGQVFSIFALYRFVKRLFGKGQEKEINLKAFEQYQEPKMSRKPLIVFLLMVVGLPYLMHKLIQLISKNQHKLQTSATAATVDPSKLEFARAVYDFSAESQSELSLKKGDIVAIISKTDPVTNATSQWWHGRLRDGTLGMFPANYVEIIQKGPASQNQTQKSPEELTEKIAVK
ncbi:Peroxin 13, N-terminal region-domain-containing protein [Sporodiniella umbellata]|nr:Peroxin 13, N-terminal region-domain-containing protein [Sporodiniella umbellata]